MDRYGLVPTVYDYDRGEIVNPYYQLNPEVIESSFYLWKFTGNPRYLEQVAKYYADIEEVLQDGGGLLPHRGRADHGEVERDGDVLHRRDPRSIPTFRSTRATR